MEDMSPAALRRRYQTAEALALNWRALFQETYQYCIPERDMYVRRTEGGRHDQRLYTSLPITATDDLADQLSGFLTPYGHTWAMLDAGGGAFDDESQEAKMALLAAAEKLAAAIDASNYHTAAAEVFLDLAIGTGCLFVGPAVEAGRMLHFEAVPLGQLALERDRVGAVSNVFRKRTLSLRECQGRWPAYDWSRAQAKHGSKPDRNADDMDLLELCVEVLTLKGEAAPPNNYYHCVMLMDGAASGADEDDLLEEHWLPMNPFIVARWSVVTGETFGRGPCTMGLADIKQLNKLLEYTFRATWRSIAPPVLAGDDGVFNPRTSNIQPNTITPVRSTNPAHNPAGVPVALQTGGDFQLAILNQQKLEDRISDILLSEQFADHDAPSKSAEEVAARQQRFARRVGAKYPRLVSEYLKPLVDRVLHVLDQAGLFADEKEALQGRGLMYSVPKSPAEMQRRLYAMMQFAQAAAALHPAAPLAALKLPEAVHEIADNLDVPADVVNSKEDIARMIEEAAKAASGGAQAPGPGQQQQAAQAA